jgi:ADP-ribose pyrophosphatase YjhB (NUDIX family)
MIDSSSPVWRPHVTVAAVVEREGRFLLVEEETEDGLRLNQPAGHLEYGESLVQAVVRETLEETRHDFEPLTLLGCYLLPAPDAQGTTYLRVAFSGRLGPEHPERVLDAGIVRTLWLTRGQIAQAPARLRSPLVLRCVDDHLAGRRGELALLHIEGAAGRPGTRPASGAGGSARA